jgi:hypothetical protein
VCGISDYGLIKISDLYQNIALSIGEGTKIANVTVAANPYRRTFRQLARPAVLEPIVEFDGTTAHIACADGAILRFRVCVRIRSRSSGFVICDVLRSG